MHDCQEMWWKQVQSDMAALDILRQHGTDPCHQLHYWQMATEKLGKAYFCKPGHPPLRTHATLVFFPQIIGKRPKGPSESNCKSAPIREFFGFPVVDQCGPPVGLRTRATGPGIGSRWSQHGISVASRRPGGLSGPLPIPHLVAVDENRIGSTIHPDDPEVGWPVSRIYLKGPDFNSRTDSRFGPSAEQRIQIFVQPFDNLWHDR